MEITVFAKAHTTKEGKRFYTFHTILNNKVTGESFYTTVKLKKECPPIYAENCPMNIIIEKNNANLTHKKHVSETTGKEYIEHILWLGDFVKGSEWVDDSMYEFF